MDSDAISDRARAIAALPGFNQDLWWLTFYVAGDPAALHRLAERLMAIGGVNLDVDGFGFFYPKLPVPNDPAKVGLRIMLVQQFAVESCVELVAVDVDVSPEVGSSPSSELVSFAPSQPSGRYTKTNE